MHTLIPCCSVHIFQRHCPAEFSRKPCRALRRKPFRCRQMKWSICPGNGCFTAHNPVYESQQGIDSARWWSSHNWAWLPVLPWHCRRPSRDFEIAAHGTYPPTMDCSLLISGWSAICQLARIQTPSLAESFSMRKTTAQKHVIGVCLEPLVGKFRFVPDQPAHMEIQR